MRPSTLLASGVASLLALSPLPSHAGTEDHFILTRVSTLGHFRYDPIVNPVGVSAQALPHFVLIAGWGVRPRPQHPRRVVLQQ